MYVKDGKPVYVHNYFDHDYYYVEASEPLPSGTVSIRYHFDFDGEYGGGGTGRLYYNDKLVGEGRVDKTVPNIFSADETLDIGCDRTAWDRPETERLTRLLDDAIGLFDEDFFLVPLGMISAHW